MASESSASEISFLKIISAAIKKGASLDYLYTEMLDKKLYRETDIQQLISEAAKGLPLMARQEVQLNNLQRKRSAYLERLFGR